MEKVETKCLKDRIVASNIMAHCTLLRESLEARNSHTKKVQLM